MVDFNGLIGLVKQRVDLVEFLEQHGMDVRRSGTRYWALCPFHDEDTPSFSIDQATGRYYCFGCRETGDVFTFLQKTEGLTFREALEEECEALHIEYHQSDEEIEEGKKRKVYMEILAETWRFFREQYDRLPEDHIVKQHEIREKRMISSDAWANHRKVYMEILAETWRFFREQYDRLPEDHIVKQHEIREKRMISSDAWANHNLFGWAPASRTALIRRLRSKGFEMQDMVAAGAISEKDGSYYCLWSERLMFPICDLMGRPVGFSGRLVRYDEGPGAGKPARKYVNSNDNEIYHKSNVLFGQSIARRQAGREHRVFVVEGQFDVIAMQVAGHDNTVASSGTALSSVQTRSLQRMVGDEGKIVFMFDADAAGQKAAIRTFKKLGSLQSQAWACVTEGKDPSEMLAEGGVDALNRRLESTTELWRHVLGALKSLQSQAWACVTEGKDPSEMLAEGGVDALNRRLESTTELWRHVLGALKAQYDLGRPDQSREFLAAFGELWETINDSIIAESAVRLASLWTGVSVAAIKGQLGTRKASASPGSRMVVPESNLTGRNVVVGDHTFEVTPDIALNASALAEPDKRFVLEHVEMQGLDEEFRRWLLTESNGGSYPEEPFDLKTGERYEPKVDRVNVGLFDGGDEERQAYIQALYRLNDEAHRFDLASSMMLNTAELMHQQVEIWMRVHAEERCRSSMASLDGVGEDLDLQVLQEYAERVREIIEERDGMIHGMEDELGDVLIRLSEMRKEQQERDAEEREERISTKVDEAVRRTRSAFDLTNRRASADAGGEAETSMESAPDAVDVDPAPSDATGTGMESTAGGTAGEDASPSTSGALRGDGRPDGTNGSGGPSSPHGVGRPDGTPDAGGPGSRDPYDDDPFGLDGDDPFGLDGANGAYDDGSNGAYDDPSGTDDPGDGGSDGPSGGSSGGGSGGSPRDDGSSGGAGGRRDSEDETYGGNDGSYDDPWDWSQDLDDDDGDRVYSNAGVYDDAIRSAPGPYGEPLEDDVGDWISRAAEGW